MLWLERLRGDRLTGVLALLCVVMMVLLAGKPAFSNASRPPRGITDPVLALQMARNVEEVDAILSEAPSPDREAMRIKQRLDFGFIACYVALYLALSARLARSFQWGRVPAIAAGLCGVAAGVFDMMENLAILNILDVKLSQTTQAMVSAIHRPSLAKWTLAFAAIGLLSSYFLAQPRWTMRMVGALFVATAAVGFYGLHDNQFLMWAGYLMLAGLGAVAAALFRVK